MAQPGKWQYVLSMVAGIGLLLPVASFVEKGLEPILGVLGATLVSMVAAITAGSFAGLVLVLPVLLRNSQEHGKCPRDDSPA